MNFDVEITFDDGAQDPDFGEAVFESFLDTAPEWDPLVTQDAARKILLVELTITAATIVDANQRLAEVLRAVAGKLEATPPMTGVHIDAADAELALA